MRITIGSLTFTVNTEAELLQLIEYLTSLPVKITAR